MLVYVLSLRLCIDRWYNTRLYANLRKLIRDIYSSDLSLITVKNWLNANLII